MCKGILQLIDYIPGTCKVQYPGMRGGLNSLFVASKIVISIVIAVIA